MAAASTSLLPFAIRSDAPSYLACTYPPSQLSSSESFALGLFPSHPAVSVFALSPTFHSTSKCFPLPCLYPFHTALEEVLKNSEPVSLIASDLPESSFHLAVRADA